MQIHPPAPALPLGEAAVPPGLSESLGRWLDLPVYRSRLPGAAAARDFFALPFITKREMRENFPANFLHTSEALASLLADERVELEHTSGTSEERTPVLLGRGWWQQQEERALRLNAHVARCLDECPAPRRVVLTTPVCNGTACHSRWAPRSARTLGDALYINQARIPFLLAEAELQRMAEEAADWAPLFLDLDPVHGAWFALHCERRGIRFPSLRFILCSYEYVSVVHRRILERAFGVPVLNLYGSTETGHLLMQDAAGQMRASEQTAFLELVEPDAAGAGDLVVTTLSNEFMPLVRYRIGDLASRRDGAWRIEGRARDALRSAAGERITTGQADACFAGLEGMAHYQLHQTEAGECALRLIPESDGIPAAVKTEVALRLRELLQTRQPIPVEETPVLGPTPSGKFRLTFRG